MKVVLLEDVRSLGKCGDVVKTSDGYARNYLIPKKLAVEATRGNLSRLKQQKEGEEKREARALEQAQEQAKDLESKTLQMKAKTGEGGRLFGAVSSKEIASEMQRQYGLEIDKKKIVLPEPIKTLGSREVSVKLHRNVTAKITVNVVEE